MNWGYNTCVDIVVTHQYLGTPVQVRHITEQTYSGHSRGHNDSVEAECARSDGSWIIVSMLRIKQGDRDGVAI